MLFTRPFDVISLVGYLYVVTNLGNNTTYLLRVLWSW